MSFVTALRKKLSATVVSVEMQSISLYNDSC